MSFAELLPLLSIITLVAFIGIAMWSKKKTVERMNDPNAEKSTLAADKDSHGKPADV